MTPDVIAILGVGLSLAGLIVGTTLPRLRDLRREILSLQDRMDRSNEGLRDQIAGLEGRMSQLEIGMTRFEAKVNERMDRLETKLNERMTRLETKLNERMTRLEAKVREQMTHFEVEMRQRMSHLEAAVRERIAHIEGLVEGLIREQKEDTT